MNSNSLKAYERRLIGNWSTDGERVVADDAARRIEALISSELRKLAVSDDGWDTLYIDEHDHRYWELTYPHKEWHGGGPPTLENITDAYARAKYRVIIGQ